MRETTKKTLRFWSIAEIAYTALLALAATALIPWKTPFANIALLAYAAMHGAAGVLLVLRPAFGRRLAVIGATAGVLAAIGVCAGLAASFVYLKDVFGDFGLGAAIGALLFASVALQILGLYPALALRALMRREVREDLGAGTAPTRVIAAALVLSILFTGFVYFALSRDVSARVPTEARTRAIEHVRAVIDGAPSPVDLRSLEGIPVGAGPLFLTLWERGGKATRVSADGDDLAEAVARAARVLAKRLEGRARPKRAGMLEVSRIASASPVPLGAAPVVAVSVNPGLDGLRRAGGGEDAILLADDLVRAQLFGAAPLVPGIKELRLGLDARRALSRLEGDGRLERIRVESWVEAKDGARPSARGNTPLRSGGPSAWRAAAISGGEFILRQIREDGRFHYRYLPISHSHPKGGDYSLPRHAGTIYALALLFGHTRDARFEEGARRATAWLEGRLPARCARDGMTCVAQGDEAWLGSAALTAVGMLEYQRRTGDSRYEGKARALAEFIAHMQRPDGDFAHLYRIDRDEVDQGPRMMFFSEEAALALVMAHEVLGDDRYLDAARRALDYLTGPKYDYFLGRFIYGADHWTCIAAHEAWPRLRSPEYLEFCRGYARFIGRLQYEPGEWENEDFTGHYGFGALMVPQAPAAAGFTEAIISTYELSRLHGAPDEALRRQAALALDALSRDQIRADNSWMMRRPEFAAGGVRRSLVEQEVRIDFTQHAASALIRGAAM